MKGLFSKLSNLLAWLVTVNVASIQVVRYSIGTRQRLACKADSLFTLHALALSGIFRKSAVCVLHFKIFIIIIIPTDLAHLQFYYTTDRAIPDWNAMEPTNDHLLGVKRGEKCLHEKSFDWKFKVFFCRLSRLN